MTQRIRGFPSFREGDGCGRDGGIVIADKEIRHSADALLRQENAFVLTREPADAELLKGITKLKSHFGKTCGKMGIEVIAAGSPQAKGRAERSRALDQDGLVIELRLAGISTKKEGHSRLSLQRQKGTFLLDVDRRLD